MCCGRTQFTTSTTTTVARTRTAVLVSSVTVASFRRPPARLVAEAGIAFVHVAVDPESAARHDDVVVLA